jgi:hypothetical protein
MLVKGQKKNISYIKKRSRVASGFTYFCKRWFLLMTYIKSLEKLDAEATFRLVAFLTSKKVNVMHSINVETHFLSNRKEKLDNYVNFVRAMARSVCYCF